MPWTKDVFPHGCLSQTSAQSLPQRPPWSPRTSLLPGARADPGKVLELDGGPEDSIGGTKLYTKLTIPGIPSRLLNAGAFLLPTWEHPRVSEIPEPSVEAGSVAVI